jgi:salicylate hydroxylase
VISPCRPVGCNSSRKLMVSYTEGDTDTELGHVDLRYIRETYGYPHMVGHRSSLAGALFKGCQQHASIKFHFSTSIAHIDAFMPAVQFTAQPRHGTAYPVTADVLLAADGVKSHSRTQILRNLGVDATVEDTGQAAYRIMLKREEMAADKELLELIDADRVTRWIGEKRHIIAYPVSGKSIYNISTVQPDTNFAAAPSATYTTKGSKSAMLDIFGDFCDKVRRMLELVPEGEVCEWKLRIHAPLPTWVHGSVALVGDACHPTLPHLAQGAAQAIEDAAVLAVCLLKCPNPSDPMSLNKSLRVYEKVRKERAETLVALASASGRALHLGQGKDKEERDRVFRESGGKAKVPDKWADAEVQRMIYGFDCEKSASEEFDKLYENLGEGVEVGPGQA